jgi:hypothetical protein
MIVMHEEKDKNSEYIISQLELQIQQYDKMSDDLHKELKGQRTKSFLWKAAAFIGVITTSYLLITK